MFGVQLGSKLFIWTATLQDVGNHSSPQFPILCNFFAVLPSSCYVNFQRSVKLDARCPPPPHSLAPPPPTLWPLHSSLAFNMPFVCQNALNTFHHPSVSEIYHNPPPQLSQVVTCYASGGWKRLQPQHRREKARLLS